MTCRVPLTPRRDRPNTFTAPSAAFLKWLLFDGLARTCSWVLLTDDEQAGSIGRSEWSFCLHSGASSRIVQRRSNRKGDDLRLAGAALERWCSQSEGECQDADSSRPRHPTGSGRSVRPRARPEGPLREPRVRSVPPRCVLRRRLPGSTGRTWGRVASSRAASPSSTYAVR